MEMKSWKEKALELEALRERLPGCSRTDELIQVSEGIDSNPISMATITLVGSRPGPRVWIQAQTHGDEPNPTEAILRVLREVQPEQVAGALVAAPAMHSAAVRAFQRESPLDSKNGNRIWGIDWTKLGNIKVSSYIWMHRVTQMIKGLAPDLMIEMHDGGVPLRIMSHALYAERSMALGPVDKYCYRSGMKVVWVSRDSRFGGGVNGHMHELGIPSIMLEAGGTGQFVEEDIKEMAFGIRNVLRAIGMLPGKPEVRADEQWTMVRGDWVRSNRAGLFYRDVQLAQLVREGQVIGRISNLFGQIIEEVRSPIDGFVFGLRHAAVANVGDYIANIGKLQD